MGRSRRSSSSRGNDSVKSVLLVLEALLVLLKGVPVRFCLDTTGDTSHDFLGTGFESIGKETGGTFRHLFLGRDILMGWLLRLCLLVRVCGSSSSVVRLVQFLLFVLPLFFQAPLLFLETPSLLHAFLNPFVLFRHGGGDSRRGHRRCNGWSGDVIASPRSR